MSRFEVSEDHKARVRVAYEKLPRTVAFEASVRWLRTRFKVDQFAQLPWRQHEDAVQAFEHFAAGSPDYFVWFTPSRPESESKVRL